MTAYHKIYQPNEIICLSFLHIEIVAHLTASVIWLPWLVGIGAFIILNICLPSEPTDRHPRVKNYNRYSWSEALPGLYPLGIYNFRPFLPGWKPFVLLVFGRKWSR
jgi:hypothetical protein